jgi:hypothetical protein
MVQGHLLTYGGQAAPTIKTATSVEMEFFVPIRIPPMNAGPLLATCFDETGLDLISPSGGGGVCHGGAPVLARSGITRSRAISP